MAIGKQTRVSFDDALNALGNSNPDTEKALKLLCQMLRKLNEDHRYVVLHHIVDRSIGTYEEQMQFHINELAKTILCAGENKDHRKYLMKEALEGVMGVYSALEKDI